MSQAHKDKVIHRFILFDVDDTLIDYKKTIATFPKNPKEPPKGKIFWNGGNVEVWRAQLESLRKEAREHGIILHFGIATSKAQGDALLGAVTEDDEAIKLYNGVDGVEAGSGLKGYFDKALIFITNNPDKVTHALAVALNKINTTLLPSERTSPADICLVDNQVKLCTDARELGYRSQWVSNLSDLTTLAEQIELINALFIELRKDIGLPLAQADPRMGTSTSAAPRSGR